MSLDVDNNRESAEGWWVATIIERFKFNDEEENNMKRRCRAFSNVVILKADDKEQAYQKAIDYGKLGNDNEHEWTAYGRKGYWVFEGIASLLPVTEKIDPDGTEILFDDYHNITVGRVKSWVVDKDELEAFRD